MTSLTHLVIGLFVYIHKCRKSTVFRDIFDAKMNKSKNKIRRSQVGVISYQSGFKLVFKNVKQLDIQSLSEDFLRPMLLF